MDDLFSGYRLDAASGLAGAGAGARVGAVRHGPRRAVRIADGAPVAIKMFGSGDAERAQRESDIAGAIDHPHVVRAIDVVLGKEAIGLVFPWMEGGSLADLVAVRRRLRWPETLTVLIPLADALAAAHERDFVHGDVSAGNVLFDGAGRPMLADFGAARAATESGADVFVTPQDVAPEIVRGAVPGPASDLFSLGSIALTCLRGRAAWPADDLQDVLIQSAAGQWPELEENMAPELLRAVVRRLLEPEPEDRGSAAQLAVDLRRIGDPEPVLLMVGAVGVLAESPGAATVVRPDALRPPASHTQERAHGARRRASWRQGARTHGAWAPRSRGQAAWARCATMVTGRVSWRGAAASVVLAMLVIGAVGIGSWWSESPAAAVAPATAGEAAAPEPAVSRVPTTVLVPSAAGSGAGAGTGSGAAQPAAPKADSGPDWPRVVVELDEARSAAFVARDAALLDAVYTPGSAARDVDAERISTLHGAGVQLADSRHQVRSVRVISSEPGGRAALAVTEDQPASAIYNASGALVGYSPAVGESTVVLHLEPVRQGYRISRVEAG
ncbi:MAG: serine/threonine-protein kinase [Nakamurella sp.]